MRDALPGAGPDAGGDAPVIVTVAPGVDTAVSHYCGRPDAPVLMIVPALGVSARAYQRLGLALAEAGLNALALDLRGVGTSSVRARRGVDWGYLDLVDGELAQLWKHADARFPGARKVWLGHSLGGHLAVLHQARHPEQLVAAIALVASGAPWFRSYGRVAGPLVAVFGWLAASSSRWLGVFPGDWLRFGGPQGAQLMQEWGRFCLSGKLGPLGAEGWHPTPAMQALQRPLFAISVAGDHYAPPAATRHLAALTAGSLELQRLVPIRGEKPLGHFGWMKAPATVVELLRNHYLDYQR